MGRFTRESFIIRDNDVLRDDYQPETLEERDAELDEYAAALRPVIQGWQPNNVFLYGVTGVGKTAATHDLLKELQESADQYDDVDVNIIELNCTGCNTSYQVAVNLVNEIREPNHPLTNVSSSRVPISETGYQQKRVFRELYADLEDIGGTVLVVLDEIDNIGSDDDILYELPRARSQLDLGVKLGVIGISNDFKFRDNLSPKVKDTLCEEEILFPPYDAGELQNILRERAEIALYDDVLEDDVIPLCAAFSARDSGSARQALRLLRKAVDIAESEARAGGDAFVTEEHVREGEFQIQRQQVVEGMHSLTQHGQHVLLTVCQLAARGETPERTKAIYRRYQKVARKNGQEPLKRRRVHDHLSDLNLHGVLQLVDSSGGRGNYNEYDLDVSLSSALDALESEFGNLEGIRELAKKNGALD
ncbi:cell division control protein Ccd6 [Haloferax sp. Atlit-4N]|uniref:Cdc6/Cdc18 family protein n=1 Tax=unclassified Haloferax TaxID=2625095 RepID=UPI000E23DBC0|nr:orc1/cdc6 family replication initiation protein [Haloferax sp. Atlit-19N]RDZ39449.1 cell division control protein Ccd6 [Haloferax sp. Atlit-19N]RDZ50155.1 cell division control protein Ccd6 [Haloferax sp. Atlit-4N]